MQPQSPAIFVGTRAGLFRWQDGILAPLARGAEPVTAIAQLPGGRLVAGTGHGAVLRLEKNLSECHETAAAERGAITSLLSLPGLMPGSWPVVLAGTSQGFLLHSLDLGATFVRSATTLPAAGVPLRLLAVPGRPRSALAHFEGRGGWFSEDNGGHFEPWFNSTQSPLLRTAAHPGAAHLWLAVAADAVLRSTDDARTFRRVPGLPDGLRPREVAFETAPPWRALLLTHAPRLPPDRDDPSPLWVSDDTGLSFRPIPSHLIDRARDPCGEITAVATLRDREVPVLLLGTDRGELIEWRGEGRAAELLVDRLPPIEILLTIQSATMLDPSTSGVFLLP